MKKLLPNPVLKVDGPSTLMTTINMQEEQKRLVVHVLHYIPERRGEQFDTIEDVIPLHNVGISIRMDNRYAIINIEMFEICLVCFDRCGSTSDREPTNFIVITSL